MSGNEREQVRVLAMIGAFANLNYFSNLSPEIGEIAISGLDVYSKMQTMYQRDMDRIKQFSDYMEAEAIKRGYNTSQIMMLSVVSGFANYFLNIIRTPKKLTIWEDLNNAALKHLSKNYINFEDELDKASEIIDLALDWKES